MYDVIIVGAGPGVLNPLTAHAFTDMLADRSDYPATILLIIGSWPINLLAQTVAGMVGGPERRERLRSLA